ncbi:MAG: hypothetical protein GTN35_01850 [Nitrososphaeria archaeon]|nr:hypothetical protein [Nitrosopumilaceae archaeon]NIP09264.1 hypothetical protein [Nitrosopumilaceae archaeon]NIP91138.1 hypothetical protein [Nitrososphaeria archaeon]NIS94432.1 hypothetical protein [Nitrosopumilaceae archaeon]
MMRNLMVFSVFSLVIMMIFPAYAAVESFNLEKSFYTDEESFSFVGTIDNNEIVYVLIRGPGGNFLGMVSDISPDSDGTFSTIARPVENFFKSSGTYNATAFTDDEKEEDGISILLEYNGNKLTEREDFVLTLKSISDKTITEGKTLSFTVEVTDSSLDNLIFSLEKNPPSGAEINEDTGKFTWTPTAAQGNAQGVQYSFDIVVERGAQKDTENITITVKDPVVEQPKDEPKEQPKDEPKELGIASFVDESKDPQYYIDRYNSEPKYKAWFDENFPEYDSIYEAVGLTEPEVVEPEIGECGPGTDLIDGKCVAIEKPIEGGGCLIATAAYGSELAPQVQYLREIRDNKVMNTESGATFMTGFNEFYYSFSPAIADYERENPVFREMIKITITPLLTTLSVMDLAQTEQEIIGYGIGVILMNIGMYIGVPAIVFLGTRKLKSLN